MNREEKVIHLYTVDKRSINSICKELRCDKRWISEVLKNRGVELRHKTGWSQKPPSKEEIELFKSLYKDGLNLKEISSKTGWSGNSVKKYIGDIFEEGPKNLTEDTQAKIQDLYKSGLSSREVATKLGISKTSVLKFVDNTREPSSYRKHEVDEYFFNKIDTEEKAYWLGYLFADGSNNTKNGQIYFSQSEKDKEAVYAFKKAISSEHPVTPYTKGSSYSDGTIQYRFQVTSRIMSDDLAKHGCIANKTGCLKYPDIDQSLNSHFIRGLFDGDGSVWITGGKGGFSITGYIPFLMQVQEVLIAEAGVANTKIAIRRPDRNPDFGDIRYGGKAPMRQLYDYLYKDAKHFLRRKKEKFATFLD